MRLTLTRLLAASCLLSAATFAAAQSSNIKPGLWEATATMTWIQSPMPAGMPMFGGGPHTSKSCLTQAQIDKYGAYTPQQQARQSCQMTNVNKTTTGMTAEMVCTGSMTGNATIKSSWGEGDHATSSAHFTGAMQMGSNSKPIEWTMETTSTFKGSDCGKVKPVVIPDSK
jgi:hypothetical protein